MQKSNQLVRLIFLTVGVTALLIGAIGVFTPILPTTPFVLLAAYCFSKSSPRFHRWLGNNKVLGPAIKNWDETKSIPLEAKGLATFMLSISGLIMYFVSEIKWEIKVGILCFLSVVGIFIWTRRTSIKSK